MYLHTMNYGTSSWKILAVQYCNVSQTLSRNYCTQNMTELSIYKNPNLFSVIRTVTTDRKSSHNLSFVLLLLELKIKVNSYENYGTVTIMCRVITSH